MSLYPEQLQFKTAASIATGPNGTKVRPGATQPGNVVVYASGFTPTAALTVNAIIYQIHAKLFGLDLTGNVGYERSRREYQTFDTPFGKVEVLPKSVALPANFTANDLIALLRSEWDKVSKRSATKTGYATSIDAGSDADTTHPDPLKVPAATP
jgi:hypothetical protein